MSNANVAGSAQTDVVLVGAGIMSATLGALIRLLEPEWSITMIERLDELLEGVKERAHAYFAPQTIQAHFHVHGRDGVMQRWEPRRNELAREIGLTIDVVADNAELAHAACHQISGALLHLHYPGIFNTSGNLAFLYSPSEIDAGRVYDFSAYHLMKVDSPTALFPIHYEEI